MAVPARSIEGMDDLIAFLGARLDELEADFDGHYGRCAIWVDGGAETWCTCGGSELLKVDIAVKRQVIDGFAPCPECLAGLRCIPHDASRGESYWRFLNPDEERIARLLALPFASHPDYREEWRP